MSLVEAIILGIAQGLTEFLPVSSSGHLATLEKFFELPGEHIAFNVAVHIGTLLSVVTLYRRSLLQILKQLLMSLQSRQQTVGLQLTVFVFLASIPTGLMGFLLRDQFAAMFSNLMYVGICFMITASMLVFTRRIAGDSTPFDDQLPEKVDSLNYWKALLIGFSQGLAIAPGISRSGTTIAVALFLGLNRHLAALFSFLLMIPAVCGAAAQELTAFTWTPETSLILIWGLVSAYFSGLLGLYLVLKVVKKGRLQVFSPYLFVLGIFVLFYSYS